MAVDLDGTLLADDKSLSSRSFDALRAIEAVGVPVVIATGRPWRNAKAVAERAGLDQLLIAYNGAAMWSGSALEVVQEIDVAAASEALRRLRAFAPDVILALETSTGWYLDEPAGLPPLERGAPLLRGAQPDARGPLESFLGPGSLKLLALHQSFSPAQLAEPLGGLPLASTWSLPYLLEVHHEQVDKSLALARLTERLSIDPASVVAFGDQHNDRGMLAWAGLGVAMANAAPEALAVADMITYSNVDDGVARVLESWLAPEAVF